MVKKVLCKHCGAEISVSNYSKHIRRHENHPETFIKSIYSLDHDDLFCKYCGRECKNKKSLCGHERLCRENPNRQLTSYEKHGPITGFNEFGRTSWNKGLTKETDERIQKQINTYHENHNKGLHKDTSGLNNSMNNPLTRKHLSKSMKKVYSKYTIRKPKKSKYGYYKGVWCDSSWELAYLIYVKDFGFNIIRNKTGFRYMWENSEHTYFPDFYNIDSDTYIEIKGFKSNRDTEKIAQFNHKLIVLEKEDMNFIINYVKSKYGENFISLYDK